MKKFLTRVLIAVPIAVCAFGLALHPGTRTVRTGIGSAAPTPVRAKTAEEFLNAAALSGFESVARLSVAELAPRRVFVHAGVVGWKGRAIVVPGPTFNR